MRRSRVLQADVWQLLQDSLAACHGEVQPRWQNGRGKYEENPQVRHGVERGTVISRCALWENRVHVPAPRLMNTIFFLRFFVMTSYESIGGCATSHVTSQTPLSHLSNGPDGSRKPGHLRNTTSLKKKATVVELARCHR